MRTSSLVTCLVVMLMPLMSWADSIPAAIGDGMQWRMGARAGVSHVFPTNRFLKGVNSEFKEINTAINGDLRADFSFNPDSRWARMYPGVYQGLGVGVYSYLAGSLIGTPVAAYVYQGAPIAHLSPHVWIVYEWNFGAAFGWKHYERGVYEDNVAISTNVTALIRAGFNVNWQFAPQWILRGEIDATHYSNGNTSWPNEGLNSAGLSVGIAYLLNAPKGDGFSHGKYDVPRGMLYDVVAYGAWRKRAVDVGGSATMCPGHFGIVGLQFAPIYRFNQWFAAGAGLDLQYDESAGLAAYWVEETQGDDIKFYHPPFGKQVSMGFSVHAELIAPIFAVNVGLGCEAINPEGEKRFYQMLTLKTFVTSHIFLNIGYRLGNFSTPQNLLLGIGYRF